MGFIIANDFATMMNVETALLLAGKLVNLGTLVPHKPKKKLYTQKKQFIFFKNDLVHPISILVLVHVTLPLSVLKLNLANLSLH